MIRNLTKKKNNILMNFTQMVYNWIHYRASNNDWLSSASAISLKHFAASDTLFLTKSLISETQV